MALPILLAQFASSEFIARFEFPANPQKMPTVARTLGSGLASNPSPPYRNECGSPREIERSADARIRIPMSSSVESLNAAAAAAVLFYEAARQRNSPASNASRYPDRRRTYSERLIGIDVQRQPHAARTAG